jgi:murein DD-endopeptidase MepM/ murein hydrolase activator NlpD
MYQKIPTKLPSGYFKKIRKILKTTFLSFLLFFLLGTVYVNSANEKKDLVIPVVGATRKNWDKTSYWHPSWGKSVVHKGIDIFALQKTKVLSPVSGLIISNGYSENGGNYLYILGPKLRVFYFAHLNEKGFNAFKLVKAGEQIGLVGNSGNAIGKPYHLHFSIFSLFPFFKNFSNNGEQRWLKLFYLDPNHSLITS